MGARDAETPDPPPAWGQPGKYSLRPGRPELVMATAVPSPGWVSREWATGRAGELRWTGMRAVLELLGVIRPDPSRREPVALPAWARRIVPLLVVALTLASTALYALVRAITS